jgi:Transposase DDE domain
MKQNFIDEISKSLVKVPIVSNLARKKFLTLFIVGLVKSRNVQFCEIAQHLNDKAKLSSNEIRIQDFFREVELDYFYVAVLLVSLLPKKGKVRLCIDRTEWDFGACQVNILMIMAGSGSMQIPLYWELLDNKSGNSSTEDRIELLELCIALVGKERIGLLIGDREFVGHKWMKYLKDNGLQFVMRLPKHHLIQRSNGDVVRVDQLCFHAQAPLLLKDCLVDGIWADVWVKPLGAGEYLFLLGTAKVEFFGQFYRKRWSIETCFQSFKQRGFNLEKTHLKHLTKLKKLVALVSIAYSFCQSVGIYVDQKVKKIKSKTHGYKAKSFTRKGIDLLRQITRPEQSLPAEFVLRLQALLRWIISQIDFYQALKKAG